MDKAYTSDYQLINAKDAVPGRKYFCPSCNGEFNYYPGTKNTSHFRHKESVPKAIKDACELYTNNLGEHSIYEKEFTAQQSVRLVLVQKNDKYIFKLKFPLINQIAMKMQNQDLYFNYHCLQLPSFRLNTVNLLPVRQNNEIEVPLISKYTFNCTNQKYEKMLGLNINGDFEPFSDEFLIFKEISGEFISIPYRRLTLSGLFFIVSTKPLESIHSDLELINIFQHRQYFIYKIIMPVTFYDDLQNWFTNTGYTLLSSTCHIDLIKPVSFKKYGTTFELISRRSSWLVSSVNEANCDQRIILIKPNNERQIIKVPLNRIVELELIDEGDYLLFADKEATEILTLRYNPKLVHLPNFKGAISANSTDLLFKVRELKTDSIKLETELPIAIHTEDDLNYEIKNSGSYPFYSPIRIDIPTLWSVYVHNPSEILRDASLESILCIYDNYHLFPKITCSIKDIQLLQSVVLNSSFTHKNKIIYYIRRYGIRVPTVLAEIMKGLK